MLFFIKKTSAVALLIFLIFGCAGSGKEENTVKNYNLGKPDKFLMPESLLEISGISFYKGKADTVYGIQDEQGRLFRLAWVKKNNTMPNLVNKATMKM